MQKRRVDQLIAQAPFDREIRKLEIMVMLTLGDLTSRKGELNKAAITWQAALGTLNENFEGSPDPQVRGLLALLLARSEEKPRHKSPGKRIWILTI